MADPRILLPHNVREMWENLATKLDDTEEVHGIYSLCLWIGNYYPSKSGNYDFFFLSSLLYSYIQYFSPPIRFVCDPLTIEVSLRVNVGKLILFIIFPQFFL